MRYKAILAAGLMLSACATSHFHPPEVQAPTSGEQTMASALDHVSNMVLAYQEAANETADGKTLFKGPAYLAQVGSLAAIALGAGSDTAIVASSAGTLLQGGEAYYAPTEKSAILRDGVASLLCIQQVATGLKPFFPVKPEEPEPPKPPEEIQKNSVQNAELSTKIQQAEIKRYEQELEAFALANSMYNRNQMLQVVSGVDDKAAYLLIYNAATTVDNLIGSRLSGAGDFGQASALLAALEEKLKQSDDDGSSKFGDLSAEFLSQNEDDIGKLKDMRERLEQCVLSALS